MSKVIEKPAVIDVEMQLFMNDLEESIRQAKRREGRVTTGAEIAKRAGGRPPLAAHKLPTTLRLDADVLARWRASGKGWQTKAAAILAAAAP